MEGLERLGTYLVLDTIPSVKWLLPEIILFVAFTLAIFADLTTDKPGALRSAWVALAGLVAAFVATVVGMGWILPDRLGGLLLFRGSVAFDPFTHYFKLLFLVATILVILMVIRSRDYGVRKMGEFHALLLVVAAGMCLMASSTHLLMLYLSLDFVPKMPSTGHFLYGHWV